MQAKTLIHTENERKKTTLQQRITFRYFQNQQIAYELSSTLIQMCFDPWIHRFHPMIAWTHCFGSRAEHRGGECMVE